MSNPTVILIRDLVRMIEEVAPVADKTKTSDTFKCGNPDLPVTAVVVTFMATRAVLEEAVKIGANLVITHEPTFYLDPKDAPWIENDPVFLSKKSFLDRHRLTIWQLHDGLHRRRPDTILQGMVERLGWKMPEDSARPNILRLESTSLRALALHCRNALNIGPVRVVGSPDMLCSNIALLLGACGGCRQLENLCLQGADVVICGESPEWETCEYVRDSCRSGIPKGLIVIGHANSEEAGMEYCAEWLRGILPASVPIRYIPAGDPFYSV